MMRSSLAKALWLSAALLSVARTHWESKAVEDEEPRFCDWKCLVFVQMWPGSFCVGLGANYSCAIPTYVKNWTIHGLWPDQIMHCCSCWPLFQSDLQDLPSQLAQHWPTLINLTDFFFWKNEWIKHGTCAGCIESLSSPSKYFGMALKLRMVYNIDTALQKAGIVPSCNESYQYNSLYHALLPIAGEAFELQCMTDPQGRQILMQIKISLFRNFSSGCFLYSKTANPSPYRGCSNSKTVFYFPIRPDKPREPCP
ncbi:ribonuclease T2-like [Ambystoma mexicanum]|uniref:ribonuclease T2-like n=1 Tax=Ambystoma mexicanum TaxID=8296 RepID=UPI0037E7A9F8